MSLSLVDGPRPTCAEFAGYACDGDGDCCARRDACVLESRSADECPKCGLAFPNGRRRYSTFGNPVVTLAEHMAWHAGAYAARAQELAPEHHPVTYNEAGDVLTPTLPIDEKRLQRHISLYGRDGTEQWVELRAACLRRDRNICQRCNKSYRREKLTAHHVVPRAEGGPHTLANLLTLCVPCHDWVEVAYEDEALPRNHAAIVGSWNGESLSKAAKLRLQVLELHGRGLVPMAIADRLGIGDRRVKSYIAAARTSSSRRQTPAKAA